MHGCRIEISARQATAYVMNSRMADDADTKELSLLILDVSGSAWVSGGPAAARGDIGVPDTVDRAD